MLKVDKVVVLAHGLNVYFWILKIDVGETKGNERGMRIRSISISFKTMAAETRVSEVVGNNGLHTYTCGHTHLEFV